MAEIPGLFQHGAAEAMYGRGAVLSADEKATHVRLYDGAKRCTYDSREQVPAHAAEVDADLDEQLGRVQAARAALRALRGW